MYRDSCAYTHGYETSCTGSAPWTHTCCVLLLCPRICWVCVLYIPQWIRCVGVHLATNRKSTGIMVWPHSPSAILLSWLHLKETKCSTYPQIFIRTQHDAPPQGEARNSPYVTLERINVKTTKFFFPTTKCSIQPIKNDIYHCMFAVGKCNILLLVT